MVFSWMRTSAALLAVGLTTFPCVNAVLYGDEIYQDVPGGKFWAFYTGGIAVIDPETCSIETKIERDHNGENLPYAWNDGVYMQDANNSKGYVLIGSRVDETNAFGDVVSHMYAVSTGDRRVVTKAEVGSRVVHSYGVYPKNEFWMHSDGNGLFYVINLDDLETVAHNDIEAKVEKAAHGKLLWDESPKLGKRGFATSTGETFLFEIDLEKKEQVLAYDFSPFTGDKCKGLHAIAYSEVNEHVYAECSGSGGAIEFDVSGGSIQFVHQFEDANGALYETPDGRFVVASDKGGNALHVFVPKGNGNKSSVEYTVPMKGNPSTVSFYTNDKDETIACSPMTENLNRNQRRMDGSVACGFYEGCKEAQSADDVASGVCLYDEVDSKSLKRYSKVLMLEETNTVDLDACGRCADSINYTDEVLDAAGNTQVVCVCTPHCGSCDPNPVYSDDESGYMCVNLSAYVKAPSTVTPTLIPNTGGVVQGKPYGGTAECSYGRTYRTHKRGTKYDAAVTNIPNDSIVIINMETSTKKCTVNLPAKPSKVLYAPNEPVGSASLNKDAGTKGSAASSPSATPILGFLGLVTTMFFV